MKRLICFLLCLSVLLSMAACSSNVPRGTDTSVPDSVESAAADPEPAPKPEIPAPVISLPIEEDASAGNLSDSVREIYNLMCDRQDEYLDGLLNGTDNKYAYVTCEDGSNEWHPGVEFISAAFSQYGENSVDDFLDICAFETDKEAHDEIRLRLDDALVGRLQYVRDFDADEATYYVESIISDLDCKVSLDFVHDRYVVHVESVHCYTSEGSASDYVDTVVLPKCVDSINSQLDAYGLGDWFSLSLSMVAR